jgi:putative phosphoesterase
MPRQAPERIGLISDTHGLLRPEALSYLRGSSHIIHAGDIGDENILKSLEEIAPVIAVRGNNDTQRWASKIPLTQSIEFSGVSVFVIHDVKTLRADSLPPHTRVVVAGHSHKPKSEERDGIVWINPGSAGRRRFSLPIAVGELLIGAKGKITVNIRELDVR